MKKPYLVQRFKFKEPRKGNTFDGVLSMDYMGSSEFEWGALSESLKRLCQVADSLIVLPTQFHRVVNGVTTKVFLIAFDKKGVLAYPLQDIYDKPYDLKENPYFAESLNVAKDEWKIFDAWWDIENDVLWAVSKANAKKIVKTIVETRDKKKQEGALGWF